MSTPKELKIQGAECLVIHDITKQHLVDVATSLLGIDHYDY